VTTGAFYFWGTLYWLVQTMTTFGGLSTPTSAFAALMLVAYLSLFPGLFAVFQARFAKAFGRTALLLAPLSWIATEMGRTYIWDGFPWELLGYSQVTVIPVAQVASIAGVYGLDRPRDWCLGRISRARSPLDVGGYGHPCGRSAGQHPPGPEMGQRGARSDHGPLHQHDA
jgi:hypothetical protein